MVKNWWWNVVQTPIDQDPLGTADENLNTRVLRKYIELSKIVTKCDNLCCVHQAPGKKEELAVNSEWENDMKNPTVELSQIQKDNTLELHFKKKEGKVNVVDTRREPSKSGKISGLDF